MPTKVSLRSKAISKGRESLYLDFYPPIKNEQGKATRRKALNMYVPANPKTADEKKRKAERLKIAEDIRYRRENELIKQEVYSEHKNHRP